MTEEDLSDEQLKQLLNDAAQRLKAKKVAKSQTSSQYSIPSIGTDKSIQSYITKTSQGVQVDPALGVKPEERVLANGIRRVDDPVSTKSKTEKIKKSTAGSDWYNLPRTQLTPELKRDLQLLRMRDTIDPKRFYKKDTSKPQVPEFSQVGTIIEGPTEYFSSRLLNRDRKRTFVEEVLAGETATGRFKSKYNEIQASKTSGKKAYYNKMKAMRRSGSSKR